MRKCACFGKGMLGHGILEGMLTRSPHTISRPCTKFIFTVPISRK